MKSSSEEMTVGSGTGDSLKPGHPYGAGIMAGRFPYGQSLAGIMEVIMSRSKLTDQFVYLFQVDVDVFKEIERKKYYLEYVDPLELGDGFAYSYLLFSHCSPPGLVLLLAENEEGRFSHDEELDRVIGRWYRSPVILVGESYRSGTLRRFNPKSTLLTVDKFREAEDVLSAYLKYRHIVEWFLERSLGLPPEVRQRLPAGISLRILDISRYPLVALGEVSRGWNWLTSAGILHPVNFNPLRMEFVDAWKVVAGVGEKFRAFCNIRSPYDQMKLIGTVMIMLLAAGVVNRRAIDPDRRAIIGRWAGDPVGLVSSPDRVAETMGRPLVDISHLVLRALDVELGSRQQSPFS